MFNYYHTFPTCPHCLEPNFKGISIIPSQMDEFCQKCNVCEEENCYWDIYSIKDKVFNQVYHCSSCDAVFNKFIDLSEFEDTINKVDGLENNTAPLIWNIELNKIEEDYINWIDEINGKFLITWPWNEVKFIPILAIEYLTKYPDRKIVIVDEFLANDSNEIFKPNFMEIFESLHYSKDKIPLDEDLKNDYRKFKFKNIFKKINKFHHQVTFKYADDTSSKIMHSSKIYKDISLLNYNKMVIDELREEFGKDCINEDIVDGVINNHYSKGNGIINLKVDKQSTWTQKKFKFKVPQLWENIINFKNFNQPKDDFRYISIYDENNIDWDNDYQIYFISKDLENLFDVVSEINPDVVIFPNADMFITEYSIYYSQLGRSFNNFIDNTSSDCLLFSTDKEIRHLYNRSNFLNKEELIFHTWDADLVLKEIEDEENYTKTLCSSSFNEIGKIKDLDFSYIEVVDLNEFEELISEIFEKTKDKGFRNYLSALLRTPLLVNPEEDYLEFKLYNSDLTFEDIASSLFNSDEDLYEKLYSVYEDIYDDEENPILTKILEVIDKQLSKTTVKKVILVLPNNYEISIFKKILKYKDKELDESVELITWGKLNDITDVGSSTVIISTSYPRINYKLYQSNFNKFIFMGSKNYLEKIRTILENRVDTTHSQPIHYLEDEKYPNLLGSILKSADIKITEIEEAPKYFIEEEIELPEEDEDDNTSIHISDISLKKSTLSEDETVLLILNNNNKGLFVPKTCDIMFKDPATIVDNIRVNEKNFSKLVGKEIILNKNNFMISFKDIFYKFIVDEGDGIQIQSETYSFDNFYDLINTLFDWRTQLKNCIKIIQKEVFFETTAIDKLALRLGHSETYAKDLNYIINFWLSDRHRYEIKTKRGVLNIYDIEMPKKHLNDLLAIYGVIKQFNDEIDVNESAFRCYVAFRYFDKIRNNFLKHQVNDPLYIHLFAKFNKNLDAMVKRQDSYRVWDVKKVKLTKDVNPFVLMDNFNEFI